MPTQFAEDQDTKSRQSNEREHAFRRETSHFSVRCRYVNCAQLPYVGLTKMLPYEPRVNPHWFHSAQQDPQDGNVVVNEVHLIGLPRLCHHCEVDEDGMVDSSARIRGDNDLAYMPVSLANVRDI